MRREFFKRFVPRSLYGRAALILVVPIVTIQLVVSVTFIQRHYEGVTRQMTGNIMLEVGYLLYRVNTAPSLAAAETYIAELQGPLQMTVTLPASGPAGFQRQFLDFSGREMIRTLRHGMPQVVAADLLSNPDAVNLLIRSHYGLMRVVFSRHRVAASNPHQLLVLMILISILLTAIAYYFLRRQLRPITRLARAAEEFGKGRSVPYRPRGAVEVRAAGRAFVEMRARIERQIEQRTLMLSGVSHDLRTPLTRLRLGMAMLDDGPEVEALRRDLDDMERLLDSFLAFARGDALDDPEPCDLAALLGQIVDNARRGGQTVDFMAPEIALPPVRLRPQAVTRAVENLLGNARRYARRAEVRLIGDERMMRILVEDDGPGIPEDKHEEALRPFTRLDAARNQDRGGGVGLGLSIAADIAGKHGGTLRLGQGTRLGGLRVELTLAR